jgi:hypothetical protein
VGVISQPPRHRRHDQPGGLGGPCDCLGLGLLGPVVGGLGGGGLGVGGGLLGDAAQGGGLGDAREGGGGLLAFEVGQRAGDGGEHAALSGAGVHPDGDEQAQGFLPAGAGLDLDGAGDDGGQHGQRQHAGQVRWGLGGGGDRRHVLGKPARQDLYWEGGQGAGGAQGDGRGPAVLPHAGRGVGQLADQVGQHAGVSVGVGQAQPEVDHAAAAGGLGDQAGVVGGVGDGGHGLDEGVEEGAAADVGQLAGVLELAQHGDGVGGLAAVGQAEDRPPGGAVGGPVEVGLLEEGGDLDQQPPGGQDRPQHRLFSLQVVGRLRVGCGHRAQAAPAGRCGHGWSGRRR